MYKRQGLYLTQITEDGDLAVLSGSNQFSVSDKVIRGGVKIQKRDLETGDTKPQGSATLKDTCLLYTSDKTVYSLKVEAGKTATLKVSDTPKVTDTLIELFKIDMETQKDNSQGNASLAGAEFTWKYYAGFYTKNNLPAEATRTWVTKALAETDSDGTIHYVTKLADAYKVAGDSFYMQDGKSVLPLGTLTVEETKAPKKSN